MMANRRMFHVDFFSSVTMRALANRFLDRELDAQRVFERLILRSDNYGRGQLNYSLILAESFATIERKIGELGPDFVREVVNFLDSDESDSRSLAIYEVKGQMFYVLLNWEKFQGGIWNRGKSKIPDPPPEIQSILDSVLESLDRSNTKTDRLMDRPKKKLKRNNIPSTPTAPTELINFCRELFPDYEEASILKQADALDKIITVDRKKIRQDLPEEEWKHYIFEVLEWMRDDTEPNGKFPGWATVFKSIPRLRASEDGVSCSKLRNAIAAYERRNGKRQERREESPEFVSSGKVYDFDI